MKKLIYIIAVLYSNICLADLQQVLSKYKDNAKLEVEYETNSLILNSSSTQEGTIVLRKNNFNWTFTNPAHKKILFDGKKIIFIEDSDGQKLVTMKKIDNPKQLVWFQLFSNPKKVKVLKYDKKTNTYNVKIDNYKIEISIKDDLISQINYFDELDSRIKLKVKSSKFDDKSKVDFSYTPAPTDQVTEF
jgi:outer membrane lipoprotein-sorting protein